MCFDKKIAHYPNFRIQYCPIGCGLLVFKACSTGIFPHSPYVGCMDPLLLIAITQLLLHVFIDMYESKSQLSCCCAMIIN